MRDRGLFEQAERRYVQAGETQDAIAAALKISRSTIIRWTAKFNWQQKRDEWLATSPAAPLVTLYEQRRAMIQRLPELAEAARLGHIDAMHKLQLLIDKFEARAEAAGPVLDAMDRLVRYALDALTEDQMNLLRDVIANFLAALREGRA